MTNNKDTASFFENGTAEQFEYCFKLYPQALKLKAEKRCKKPQELIRLDQWYQNELPKLIKARGKDAHMIYDELVQTMKWKQSRGKFYPQLSYLVKVNTPRAVMQETKKAFRKLPNLEQAITALSNLKGVGTTMASALLAAAAPDSAPFMADECLMAIPEIEGIDYTTKEYLNFVQHIQTTVERLNAEAGGGGGGQQWSPHRVELALWAHYVANDLNPELLDQMPSGSSKNLAANGSAVKTMESVSGDSIDADDGTGKALAVEREDTNDNDDTNESLTAARGGETNNTATESETDNENTNPIPSILVNSSVSAGVLQDGDSNFVSNDSTSQEDVANANIIDEENTTQTTATTSTDDGEAGTNTPLASDSESNIEAPPKSSNNNIATSAEIDSNAATDAVATVAAAAAAATATDSSNHNNSNGDNINKAVGNGNGTLLGVGGMVNDSLDGENSSCLRSRSSANEDASEGYDDYDESNSNSVSGRCVMDNKSSTPIVSDNETTTLSNVAGQKRSMLQCNNANTGEQPEVKKIRND